MSKYLLQGVFNISDAQVDAAFNKLDNHLQNLDNRMRNMGFDKFATGATVAFGALTVAAGFSVRAWMEQEKAMKQTETVLRATGGASGMTAKEIGKLASSLQDVTTFGDETIQMGANMLLTFRNIGSNTFPRATKAMLDMAEMMGTDVKSSAIQLGKALNDPIGGIAALTRVGVQFTDAQKDQIKTLVESGNIAQAQAVILSELEGQMGGVATTAAQGSGQLKQLWNDVGDIAEGFGQAILNGISPFVAGLREVATWAKNNMEIVIPLGTAIGTLTVAVGGLSLGFLALSSGIGAATIASMKFMLTPVGAVIAAIAATVGVVVYAFRNWESVTDSVRITLLTLKKTVWELQAAMAGLFKIDFVKKEAEQEVKLIQSKIDAIKEERKAREELANAKENEAKKAALAAEAQAKAALAQAQKAAKQAKEKDKELKEEEKWLQEKEKMYGKLEKAEISYLKDKEKRTKQEQRDQLKNELKFEKDLVKKKEGITDNQIGWELEAYREKNRKKQEADQLQYEFENNIGDARLNYSKEFFGNLATLQQSKSEELFRIGQAAAIANAIINVSEGITKALSFGPIAGPILAATIAAAGAVQIGTIASQEVPFAEGGIVTGPVRGLVGEAGPEAIIPLKDGGTGIPMLAAALEKAGAKDRGPKNIVQYTNQISIYADSTTDAKKLGREVKKVIAKEEKRKMQKAKMRNT